MTNRRVTIIAIFSFLLVALGLSLVVSTWQPQDTLMPTLAQLANPTNTVEARPDPIQDVVNVPIGEELIVQFSADTSETALQSVLTQLDARLSHAMPDINGAVIIKDTPISQQQLAQLPPNVIIEPNYKVQSLLTYPTDDPMILEQWSFATMDMSLWDAVETNNTIVAVIDSGACFDHPDLQGVYLDDGYDYVDDDTVPTDAMGHGCAVSGIIAATADNGIGIAGIAPNTKILPLRVLDADGVGTYADVISAIYEAVSSGADVINLSLGGQNHSQMLEQAVNYAVANGVQVVAGSGNTGTQGVFYPARYASVIAVGSYGIDGNRSDFSTYGSEVDTLAPGEDILTTTINGNYGKFSGTSMAVPYVTGLLALSEASGQPVDLANILETPAPQENSDIYALEPTYTPTVTSTIPAGFDCNKLILSEAEFSVSGDTVTFYVTNHNTYIGTELDSVDLRFAAISGFPDVYLQTALYEDYNDFVGGDVFYQGDSASQSPLYIDENTTSYDGNNDWSSAILTLPPYYFLDTKALRFTFADIPTALSDHWTNGSFAGTTISFDNPSVPGTTCDLVVPDDTIVYQPTPAPSPTGYWEPAQPSELPPYPECSDVGVELVDISSSSISFLFEDVPIAREVLRDMTHTFSSPNIPDGGTIKLSNITLNGDMVWAGLGTADTIDDGTWLSYRFVDNDLLKIYYNVNFDMSAVYSPTDFVTAFHIQKYSPSDLCTSTPTVDDELESALICNSYADTYTLGTVDSDLEADLRQAVECANASPTNSTIDLDGQTVTYSDAPSEYNAEGHNALQPIVAANIGNFLTIRNGTIERDDTLSCDHTLEGLSSEFRFLYLDEDSYVVLENLTLRNGCASRDTTPASSIDTFGGAIYSAGQLKINNSTLTNNNAAIASETRAGIGGAIYGKHGPIIITNSNLSGNVADTGGAIYAGGAGIETTDVDVTIRQSTIDGNSAIFAGGVFVADSDLHVTDSTFSNNSVTTASGGIHTELADDVSITNSTFYNNNAVNGFGALHLYANSATITNSTFSNNPASDSEAIYVLDTPLTLANTILADSVNGTLCSSNVSNLITYAGVNLIEDGSCDAVANSQMTGDPLLDPTGLQDNGGLTETIALMPSSPAIDAGDNTVVTLPYDQRGDGYPRFNGTAVDIGAYENQSVAFFPPFPECGTATLELSAITQNSVQYTVSDVAVPTDHLLDLSYGYYSPLYPLGAYNAIVQVTYMGSPIWVGNAGSDTIDEGTWSSSPYLDTGIIEIIHDPDYDWRDYYLPDDFNTAFHVYNDVTGGYCTIYPTVAEHLLPTVSCENYPDSYTLGIAQSNLTKDLQRAIECANESASDNVIDLNSQTVSFTSAPEDYDLQGFNALEAIKSTGESGTLTIQNGVIERHTSLNVCAPSTGDRTKFRLLFTLPNSHVTLLNVSLKNGCATDVIVGANDGYGGAISNYGTLYIASSAILLNTAEDFGGAIHSQNNGTVTISESTVHYNSAKSGAGISNRDNSIVQILNSTIKHNSSTGFYGGGLFNYSDGQMIITDSTIRDNTAPVAGGGIYNYNSADMTLTRTTISENTASDFGGGVYNDRAMLEITDSVIRGNTVLEYGGGIYNTVGGLVAISGTTINNNTANLSGGGINNKSSGQITIANSTVYGNSALDRGGALFLVNNTMGLSKIINTTISNNSATNDGGGLYAGGTGPITLVNSIIANSSGSADCFGTVTFIGMNLVEDDSCSASSNGQLAGDPKFDANGLQLNTGTLPTVPLLSDSPAIDVGDSTQVTNISYDQRGEGFPRISGSQVDLGAYEYQPITVTNTPTAEPTLDTTFTPTPTFTPSPTITPSLMPTLTLTPIPTPTFTPTATQIPCQNYADYYVVGTVYSNLEQDLKRAVECANSSPVNSVIDLDNKTVILTIASVYESGYNGFELITNWGSSGKLTIQNGIIERASELTCPPNASSPKGDSFRFFYVTSGADITLRNLTLTNGCSNNVSPSPAEDKGGAIYNDGTVTIENSMIHGNRSYDTGGAIYNGAGATLSIINSTLNNNHAEIGGAIYSWVNSEVTLNNSTLSENSAQTGGALAISFDSMATIIDTIISGNTATYGAGLYSSYNTVVSVMSSVFVNNDAVEDGGALYNDNDSELFVTNSTITGNVAKNGAGIQNRDNANVIIRHTTLHANNASVTGNSINHSDNTGVVTLVNSIVADGAGTSECSGMVIYLGMNLVEDASCDAISAGQLTGDPSLDPHGLQDNNGQTPSIALQSGSVAINIGDNSNLNGLNYDQRGVGYHRVYGVQVDLGAYEYQPVPIKPRNFSTISVSEVKIDLSWDDPSDFETGYRLSRSFDSVNWLKIATLPIDSDTWSDTNVTCDQTYYYQLVALYNDIDSESAPQVISTVTPKCEVIIPDNITTTTVSSRTQVSWTPASTRNTSQVIIERSEQPVGALVSLNSDWQTIATIAGDAGIFTDSDIACGMTYSYRMTGYNATYNEYTAPTHVGEITTADCPVPVTNTVGLYQNGVWMFRDGLDATAPTVIFNFGPQESGWQAIAGDWDGDGIDGIGIYKDGVFALRDIADSGVSDFVYNFGPLEPGWQAIAGDWNGDGQDTVGVYKDGVFRLADSHSSTVDYAFNFGRREAGWTPLAGDWYQQGRDLVGLYKDGIFRLQDRLASSGTGANFVFGPTNGSWQAVSGDWDEDGISSIGIVQRNGWRLRNTNSAGVADIGFSFGLNQDGWQPIASYRGDDEAVGLLADFSAVPLSLTVSIVSEEREPEPVIIETATETPTVIVIPTLEAISSTSGEEDPSLTPSVTVTETPTATITPSVTPTHTAEPTATHLPTETPLPTDEPAPVEETQEVDP